MADKEINISKTIGSIFEEWDFEHLNMDEESLEKLKNLPERREEEIWDKI